MSTNWPLRAAILEFLQVEHLHAIHYDWKPSQELSGRVANSNVLWLVEKGPVHLVTSRGEWLLNEGDAILMGPAMERRIATPEGARWISLRLSATALDTQDLFSLVALPVKWRPEPAEWELLLQQARLVVERWFPTVPSRQDAHSLGTFLHHQRLSLGYQAPLNELICRSAMQVIFALLWQRLGPMPLEELPGAGGKSWLPAVLASLRESPGLTVDQLARALGISRRHLVRVFRQELGTTPRQYLQRRKLEDGRRLLESTELGLGDVAHRAGFDSKAHFCRIFKAHFGVNPAEYRQEKRDMALAI